MIIIFKVSTWFANARRRLKKENKMTWSPRNNRNADDEDDDEDMDERNVERPSSSVSVLSDDPKRSLYFFLFKKIILNLI